MKKYSLTRKIATVGLLFASIAIVVFVYLSMDRQDNDAPGNVDNPRLVTPKTMGSYGELMFAYIGEGNYLYNLDDETSPLVKDRASELLYASDDSVLYVVPCEISDAHVGRESTIRELQVAESGNRLNTIATVTIDPCWSSNDEVIYFVEDDSPRELRTFEPLTSVTEVTAEFEQEIAGLRVSSDGLLVSLADGSESIYVPLSKQLAAPVFDYQGTRITICEQYDLLLYADGKLDYHWQGADNSVNISNSVIAAISYQDNEIFYIEKTDHGATLNMYVVSDEEHSTLVELPEDVMPQLTANANYAFVVDERGVVYRYDIAGNTLIPYHVIDTTAVRHPMISLFDYRLMVYDLCNEPDHSFCYAMPAETAISDDDTDELYQVIHGMEANIDKAEFPGLDVLEMASMGENVMALQAMLKTDGYLNSDPNGFYDIPTMWAVRLAQYDLGFAETGVADRQLQSILLNEGPAVVPEMRQITTNDACVLVCNIQSRLRTLDFMASDVTGRTDDSTMLGLRELSGKMGIEIADDNLAPGIQQILQSSDVSENTGYIDLKTGMNAPTVFRLNRRLYDLAYLGDYPCPEVDDETIGAIRLFCDTNHLEFNGTITTELQELLYADEAIPCPEELQPERAGERQSNTPGQVISDRDLKILRKWLTKSYAVNHTDRQAVKRFQNQLVRLGYLPEEGVTMVYDIDTSNAVLRFQEENDLPANGIPDKKTLMLIFGQSTTTLSGE